MCFLLAAIHIFVSSFFFSIFSVSLTRISLLTLARACELSKLKWSTIWQIAGKRKGFEHFSSKSMHLVEEFLWVYSSVACIELIFIAQQYIYFSTEFLFNWKRPRQHTKDGARWNATNRREREKSYARILPCVFPLCPGYCGCAAFLSSSSSKRV